jgi:thiol-disulfide isomerase/thioredoxin
MPTFLRSLAAACLVTAAASSAHAAGGAHAAPEFTGIDNWLNTAPLTMQQLRGKAVLVDFWTFDCINCLHTLPYVKAWNDKYKDKGLVVVGVHTPEYGFERNLNNLKTAVQRNGITFPVAQDNRYLTWNAYDNQYWPALYLIDKKGDVVYTHFGEGNYAQTEGAIQKVLAQQ